MKTKNLTTLVLCIFLGLGCLICGFFINKTFYITINKNILQERIQHLESIILDVESIKLAEFKDSVYLYIQELNIDHPEIVFKQACIESGHFRSQLFVEHNNMFGMKMPRLRPTVGKIKTESRFKEYAYYNNWKESVIDYAIYQSYTAKKLSEKEYLDHLKRSYAEDTTYVTVIEKMHIKKAK